MKARWYPYCGVMYVLVEAVVIDWFFRNAVLLVRRAAYDD